ncbi:hypothetical protein KHP60_09880 [Microvirga sp. 3-52]|uniref:hypothetical protein n=1 Tax=Microvirga sp. 3-52 TaxID=2792425 RepID=UPI001AC68E41|nr:hypothetical protein [Microvirga sp. 3-52]MBO1905631.1 hypothetical protein [Microvirga sp. 3-52]MBS7452643.1 hypothetical protein [Microvirga sp. 3-52]
MAKAQVVVPSETQSEFDKLVEDGKALNEQSLKAEAVHREEEREGLPLTQELLAKLYEACCWLYKQSENIRAKLFQEKKYTKYVKAKPEGVQTDLPYGKPAIRNVAIPASKLICPNRDAATLSKFSTICLAAHNQGKTPEQFLDWLRNGPHIRDDEDQGGGIEGAHKAYSTPRKRPDTRSNKDGGGPEPIDWEAVKRTAFAKGFTTDDWPLKVPKEYIHEDVYFVAVRQKGPVVTVTVEPLSKDAVANRLTSLSKSAAAQPDWQALHGAPSAQRHTADVSADEAA